MSKQNPSGQAPDSGSRRQQLRMEQQRAAKEARVRKIVSYVALGLASVAVLGGIVWGVVAGVQAANQPAVTKLNTQYTVLAGKADAPVTVDVYQDYICPFCGQFERTNSADLMALVAEGKAAVRIHPMNFLDEASLGTKYSTRAANAFVTVANMEPDKMLAFNAALFANQPKENTTGLTDAEIAAVAKQTGVSQATIDAFAKQSYVDFVDKTTKAAIADKVDSTPTVFVNGQEFSSKLLLTPGALAEAITASKA